MKPKYFPFLLVEEIMWKQTSGHILTSDPSVQPSGMNSRAMHDNVPAALFSHYLSPNEGLYR